MNYVAWCDGSVTKNKVLTSYVIVDENENIVTQQKAEIAGLKKASIESEYMALYLLLKKIKELDLINIKIFSDCQAVVNDFMKKGSIKKLAISFRKLILQELDLFYYRIVTKVEWKVRKFNLAHQLFKRKDISCDLIDVKDLPKLEKKKVQELTFKKPIVENKKVKNKTIKTEAKNKNKVPESKKEPLKMCDDGIYILVPETNFKVKETVIKKFQRSLDKEKYDTPEKVLGLLHKKISASSVFDDGNKRVLVTGRLHMYMDNNIIEKINTQTSEWSELWKQKNPKDNDVIIKLKKLREEPNGPSIIVPGTDIIIEKSILNKIHTSTSSMKGHSIEKTINLVSERLRKSLKIKHNGYDVYITGRFHMYVAHNLVQDYKIFASQWSKVSKDLPEVETA